MERKAMQEAIDGLTKQIVDIFSKGYDECKYKLFTEFQDKKHGTQDIDDFVMDFEEEKMLTAILANVELSKKQGIKQAQKTITLATSFEQAPEIPLMVHDQGSK